MLEEGDWLCLQCGTYYYTGLYHRPRPITNCDDHQIGPDSTSPSWGKGLEKAVASGQTVVMPEAVGPPPIERSAAGFVVTPETGTVARLL